MASHGIPQSGIKTSSSSRLFNDDVFKDCSSSIFYSPSRSSSLPLYPKPRNPNVGRPSKKVKMEKPVSPGKENCFLNDAEIELSCGLDSIEPTLDFWDSDFSRCGNSIESSILKTCREEEGNVCDVELFEEGSTQLDELLKLCTDVDEPGNHNSGDDWECENVPFICCPLCEADISELSDDKKQIHTNECLDKVEDPLDVLDSDYDRGEQCQGHVCDGSPIKSPRKIAGLSPVAQWLRNLGLEKYEEVFVRQEIDWDALQWLTEENAEKTFFFLKDLCSIGITTLGPRKKILTAIRELQNDTVTTVEPKREVSKGVVEETKPRTNKLITEYFAGPLSERKRASITNIEQNNVTRSQPKHAPKSTGRKECFRNGKRKDVPTWCCIPGTPFRVDAFNYLRRDCSHWFLTHFHLDHYQGLTKSFCHGVVYCSSITAKLVKLKIGIPMENIRVLPLNQKINIAGIDVTCFDANHCPGAIIILFEPPNGKPVLHTGDFRFSEEMKELPILQACPVYTLILDTTYCNPKYDFPEQESVIQFVIDAIQAEAFNPKTLFLIGSYSIGKERVFMEVARVLRKKVYVTAAKLRMLECLGLPQEDMQWLTLNEQESHIHVVPMWAIASFKRLKQMSNQYMGRYNLIVSFSPTGWSFGKGQKSTGKKWRQGSIIRYEVPYSEHSSFTELKAFVKFISPAQIIPSVNNHGPDAQNSMVSQLVA